MGVTSVELFSAAGWGRVPALEVNGKTVVVTGKWLKRAEIRAEEWLETELDDPERCFGRMREERLHADVFTFAQKLPAVEPKYSYHTEWDSIAAIRLNGVKEWWDSLPQVTRKNARRSAKRGVTVRLQELDDRVIAGIVAINNETPVRQGRRFTHFGETHEEVKKDYISFLDRSELICAYAGDELIGFIKIIYCGKVAAIAKLQSKISHYDQRPSNALLVKAIERCAEKGASFVTYGRFRYGNQKTTSLMEFKLRHGFEDISVPRFYVPLTVKGHIAIKLRLHRDLVGILPEPVARVGTSVRAAWNKMKAPSGRRSLMVEQPKL